MDDGVMQIDPSGMRAEMLPAVPSTKPLRNMALAVASTSCFTSVMSPLRGGRSRPRRPSTSPPHRCHEAASWKDLRVHAVERTPATEEAGQVVGDEAGVVGLGVVGRS